MKFLFDPPLEAGQALRGHNSIIRLYPGCKRGYWNPDPSGTEQTAVFMDSHNDSLKVGFGIDAGGI
ncbi:MAG: hypothetical protein A2Y71_06300 [Bacteroidetes bacterium RBG_13_42_15]|nr:MAG: hypothetical protein A2Y71_06300 [Bacteroidetes bacterium RBG_13_42_15]